MEFNLLFYTIGSSISILAQIILIYGYFRVKVMQKHPEILIIWQCFSQIMLDSHWFTAIDSVNELVSDYCQSIGAMFVYFYYLSWNYILYLSLEILVKIKNPLNCNYSRRLQMYHMVAHLVSLTLFCVLVAVPDNDGKSVVGTCFVQKRSPYEMIVFFPVVFHVPICVGIGGYTIWLARKNREAMIFKHHNLVVLVFTLCWGTTALDHGLSYHNIYIDSDQFDLIVTILGAPAGFYLFCARMTQKGLFLKIYRSFYRKKKSEFPTKSENPSFLSDKSGLINPDTSRSSLISQTFDILTFQVTFNQATVNILEGLSKYFKYCMNSDRDHRTEISLKFHITGGKVVEIEHFFANLIRKIMQVSSINYSDLSESLSKKENLQDLPSRCKSVSGKSGAFFYFTKNKQFIIKSIKPDEMKVLGTMIREYCDLVTLNGKSLIARIFGIFRVTVEGSSPRLLMVIENLGRHFRSPLIFDLKGSTHMRQSSSVNFQSFDLIPNHQVYKDKDFLSCYRNEFSFKDGKAIFEALEKDTLLLEKYDIMDYSLLLLIEEIKNPKGSIVNSCNTYRMGNYICCVGIIDYLQNYSCKKKLETQINKLKKDQPFNYSCIPPEAYRSRFLKLMFDIFMTSGSSSP